MRWTRKGVRDMLNRVVEKPNIATTSGCNLIYPDGNIVNLNPNLHDNRKENSNQRKILLYYLHGCPFSEQAKELLLSSGYTKDLEIVDVTNSTKEAMKKHLRQQGVQHPVVFPQIVWDGSLIQGGFRGLKFFLNQ